MATVAAIAVRSPEGACGATMGAVEVESGTKAGPLAAEVAACGALELASSSLTGVTFAASSAVITSSKRPGPESNSSLIVFPSMVPMKVQT